jgi:hypothetical protein
LSAPGNAFALPVFFAAKEKGRNFEQAAWAGANPSQFHDFCGKLIE